MTPPTYCPRCRQFIRAFACLYCGWEEPGLAFVQGLVACLILVSLYWGLFS